MLVLGRPVGCQQARLEVQAMFPGGYCAGLGVGGWLLMIGFWGVLLAVVVWAVTRLFPATPTSRSTPPRPPTQTPFSAPTPTSVGGRPVDDSGQTNPHPSVEFSKHAGAGRG
jgi:hypothetical protein